MKVFCALLFLLLVYPRPAASQESNLKVGAVLGLSGPASWMGQDTLDGLRLCGAGVTIAVEDHQTQPHLGVSALNKLVTNDGINIALVSFSGVASSLIPIANARHLPLILTTVSARAVAKRGGENTVNFFTTGEQEAPIMADLLARKLKLRKAAVLYMEGDFGLSYFDAFRAAYSAAGGTIVAAPAFQRAAQDFRAELTRIKGSHPEVLYFIGYDTHGVAIARQAREVNLRARLAAVWTFSSPVIRQEHGDLFEGLLCTSPAFHLGDSSKAREFQARFHDRYHRAASAYAGIGCDIGDLLSSLKERSPAEALAALKQLQNYAGVMGTLSADGEGQVKYELHPVEIRRGMLMSLE